MKIGFLTGCLGDIPLKEKAKLAHEMGFEALEISCWPRENDRDYAGSDIDVANLTQEGADEINAYMKEYGLIISSLAYYDNNLSADPKVKTAVNDHSKKVIDAAALLGVELVGVFIGRDITKDIWGNFDEFEKVFGDLVSYAESKGVKLMIENCHMPSWLEKGKPGTISYSPELWTEMFKRIPSKSFGLNYDPSHLHAMLMDYMECLKGFEDRVFHLHAKDVEVFPEKVAKYGIYDSELGDSYWRYRMPGLGQVDWKKLTSHLQKNGYDFIISIEHEDPLYEGSTEKVLEGLRKGIAYLKEVLA